MTNKNRMPLATFVGSNHQLQNVVFGQALLRDEMVHSFTWLFKTFKTCLGGDEPHVLLTGQFSLQLVHLIRPVYHCK
jgi:hypothetical protein